VNWVTSQPESSTIRRILQATLRINPKAELPLYVPTSKTFVQSAKQRKVEPNAQAKAFAGKRKVVLFATCIVNFNKPDVGHGANYNIAHSFVSHVNGFCRHTAARALLAHNGVQVTVEYPMCCGMPQLEAGKVKEVSKRAEQVAKKLRKFVPDLF